ncbi:hypothetical protein C0Z17_04970 [Trinickia caryophylli]|nr:hypothetical protein C0Z17_04970 [Trinickia caryophylli]
MRVAVSCRSFFPYFLAHRFEWPPHAAVRNRVRAIRSRRQTRSMRSLRRRVTPGPGRVRAGALRAWLARVTRARTVWTQPGRAVPFRYTCFTEGEK